MSWLEDCVASGPYELLPVRPSRDRCCLELQEDGALAAARKLSHYFDPHARDTQCVGCAAALTVPDPTHFDAHFCPDCYERADLCGICSHCWGVLDRHGACLRGNSYFRFLARAKNVTIEH